MDPNLAIEISSLLRQEPLHCLHYHLGLPKMLVTAIEVIIAILCDQVAVEGAS
jgi:hypothetical protein